MTFQEQLKQEKLIGELNHTIEELISISLWSIRRLPTNSLKHFALDDLKKTVGDSHKFSEFIQQCKDEIK
jgi:hypothetical protein